MAAVLSVNHLSKKFGNREVLKDISFDVNEGEVVCLIGSSGSGKSTLLRCLNLLEQPTTGTVLYRDKNIEESGLDLFHYRSKVGMVFQQFNLFNNLDVLENCTTGQVNVLKTEKEEAKKRALRYLNEVGMDTYINARPAQLSGGQKQRVSIARALAHNPEILLCDEATSALDPQTTLSILSLLKRLNQTLGITIVLITHEMSVIKEICNKVAIIDAGKILEQGDVFDVFTKPNYSLTREFIETTSNLAKVKDVIKVYIEKKQPKIDGVVFLRLNFVDNQVQDSVIMSVAKTQRVDINILLADIAFLDNKQLGSLFVALTGENKREAIEALKKKGVQVEVVIYE